MSWGENLFFNRHNSQGLARVFVCSLFVCLDPICKVLGSLGPRVRGVRMLSSAALIFCWVALGRLTAYVASEFNAWDFAAGMLVLKEAGGQATDHEGRPLELTHRDSVCSTQRADGVQKAVLTAVAEVSSGVWQ